MTLPRRLLVALVGAALLSTVVVGPAGATGASEAVAPLAPAGSTPSLIEAAVARGDIGRSAADRYLAYALMDPARLPAPYISTVPWRGTLPLMALEERAAASGTTVARLAGTTDRGTADSCGGFGGNMPRKRITNHFLIRYDPTAIKGGLTIRNYSRTLETSWKKEVTNFGWPAPPFKNSANGLYHVRVENLGFGLYGFVTTNGATAGLVGNNPNTSWPDHDAYASCMVLNEDYRGFPSVPLKSLQSTAAHEFNHAIQFGEGGLTGVGAPDGVFIEGGATWMEDEVFDNANDNYFYLWPVLTNSMGDHPNNNDIYSYWVTFRGMTERLGTGVSGGGENVMQEFWELTSRELASNLDAMDGALQTTIKGASLPDSFHDAVISIRFARPCGGGYVYPFCLEEGTAYRNLVGAYGNDASISGIGGSVSNLTVRDDYAARIVGLPKVGGAYDISLTNDDTGGELRGSVVCDTGASLEVEPLSMVAGSGDEATLTNFDPAGCSTVALIITNQDQHGANPSSAAARDFTVDTD